MNRVLAGLFLMLVFVQAGPTDAGAASSCRAFFNQCAARCATNERGHSKAKCTADHCSPKLSRCRRTGCWTEGARFGGGRTCGLAK